MRIHRPSVTTGRSRRGSASWNSSGSSTGRIAARIGGDQVPAQQVGPQRRAGGRVGGYQLTDVQLAVRQEQVIVPAADACVQRVAARAGVVLGQQAPQRGGVLPLVFGVVQHPVPPRLVAGEETRAGLQHRVVHLGQLGADLAGLGDPQPQLGVGGQVRGQRPLAAPDGERVVPGRAAVAVPAVDPRLGRPQRGQCLAPVPDVRQLPVHDPRQDAPAAVGREHADPAHPGHRGRRPGQAHAETERAGDADRGAAVERGQAPVELEPRQRPGAASRPAAARRGRRARPRGGKRRTRRGKSAGPDSAPSCVPCYT